MKVDLGQIYFSSTLVEKKDFSKKRRLRGKVTKNVTKLTLGFVRLMPKGKLN
jgi:hypothetical protein